MQSLRTLLLGALVVALAACGGGPDNSSAAESTGGEPSPASSASQPAESAAESSDNGGPGATDAESLLNELVPPNSTELSRTEAGGATLVSYESTDTVGDLKSFYVQKIVELNMTVLTTTEAANTYAVAIGTDETGEGLGATIAVQNAGDVTNVIVTVAEGT
ncbi:MAG TPA: hypothetical protein VFH90_05965 [Candidatus Limnocylindria bacterium]|nr:hypothetical protein [Candidatus Limnocylindria bacterium]